MTLSRQENI